MVEPPSERKQTSSFAVSGVDPRLIHCPSELVLSRVEAFLPQFAASTAEIARRAQEDPDSVDIEKLGNEDSYIQMVRPTSRSATQALTLHRRLVGRTLVWESSKSGGARRALPQVIQTRKCMRVRHLRRPPRTRPLRRAQTRIRRMGTIQTLPWTSSRLRWHWPATDRSGPCLGGVQRAPRSLCWVTRLRKRTARRHPALERTKPEVGATCTAAAYYTRCLFPCHVL